MQTKKLKKNRIQIFSIKITLAVERERERERYHEQRGE